MSKMTDIDELLVKSQRLKTHNVGMGGLPMVGSINRGVSTQAQAHMASIVKSCPLESI
jgi:hypothetical protein